MEENNNNNSKASNSNNAYTGNSNSTMTCPRDCTRCSQAQRVLCAAQWSMMAMERLDNIEERLDNIEERLERIEDRQKDTANNKRLFNPAIEGGERRTDEVE